MERDVAAEGRGHAFPAPESGEDRRDLSADRSKCTQCPDPRPADPQSGDPGEVALAHVDEEHRQTGERMHREGHVRRAGVARPDRAGVRTTGQAGSEDRGRNAPEKVACQCSQSSESEYQYTPAVNANFGLVAVSSTIGHLGDAAQDPL